MEITRTQRLTRAGLLTALGLLLPFVTAHAFGVPGTVLLPMHLPVLLMGFLCGPLYGAAGGLLIPALSSLLTGMPPAFPMLPIMLGELCTYGLVSGLLYRRAGWHLYPSLLCAMACGRVSYGLIFAALLTANGGTLKALSVTAAVTTGLPGIVIQLAAVPLIVTAVNRLSGRQHSARRADPAEDAVLEEARRLIREENAPCVFIRDGKILKTGEGTGVRPLIAAYEQEPELLRGVFLVDKIVGKAAAMLAVLGGVQRVHGLTMSTAARDYLDAHGIPASCDLCVSVISNRTGDGLCPMEKSVLEIEDPEEGYRTLKETIRRLMAG